MKLINAGKFRVFSQVVAVVTLTAFINATWETTKAWAQYSVPSDSSGTASGGYSADSMSALSSSFAESATTTTSSSDEGELSEEAAAGGVQLPKGGDAVPAGSISLPSGASTVLGMGESFAPQLSSGVATLTVPINLPAARGGVQPKLELSYSSAGGFGLAGKGWSIGATAISRQTDRGLPKYNDQATWHAQQDGFLFGGSELVPICTVQGTSCDGLLAQEVLPVWSDGWQYFRAQIEGSFLRFFWSPDHRTWRIQTRDGANLELGFPLDGSNYEGALEANPDRAHEIYRWHLVRQYDAQGEVNAASNPMPVNQVVYRHMSDGNTVYLTDIYDTSPAANPTTVNLSQYANHTAIVYERRPDPVISYRQGWLTEHELRVSHIDVSSKPFSGSVAQPREMLRRYHLGYDPSSHDSLLTSVQVEGRCATAVLEDSSESLGNTQCPRLPEMRLSYQRVDSEAPPLWDADGYAYEPFDTTVRSLLHSPPHSLDERDTSLMDVNADGLPDVVVTSPGFYNGNHGLFLNGYGNDTPGIGFSVAQEMAVQKVGVVDSGVLTLNNPNVTALDLDADGLVNLVHITGERSYAIFTPKYIDDMGWQWTGVSQGTSSGQDIKIDFTRDSRDIQVMDVNGDGLVDVVYSSPTEMQTFFALGRYPGGDGQFGSAERTSATTSDISNDPVTTCSPWSARPARFSDPDIKVAEMNGDGLPDIVRVRSGQIIYWPGRGNGFWGTGPRDDCPAGSFAEERHIEMLDAPHYGTADTMLLNDVNGDGLSDMVEVRANEVDIYLNDNGAGWTDRMIIENTPFKTSGTSFVRLSDIDGSGTPDILWGRAFEYKYIDLTGGVRPHLLTRMDNGMGKTVEFEYASSTELMLEAQAEGNAWSKLSPIVMPVIVRSTVSDNLQNIGRPAGVYTTEYTYRDPVYDGRSRQFRGFTEAVVTMPGDSNYPTAHTRSVFLMGECPKDDNGTELDVCSDSERWKDNWREALKGLPVLSESFDDSGTYLTTAHTSYELRQLYTGEDGRRVIVPYPTTKNVFSYDTANFQADASAVQLDEVEVQLFDREPYTETRQVMRRASQGTARVRSETVYDDFGNVVESIQEGCIEGCPAGIDETVIGHSDFALPPGDGSGWMWREECAYITGSIHTEHRNEVAHEFDRWGRVTKSEALLWGSLALDRFHESGELIAPDPVDASGGINEAVQVTVVEHTYDQFGNAIASRGANNRCSGGEVDPLYAMLPVLSRTYAGELGPDGCGVREFTQQVTYDRGLQKVITNINATGQPSRYDYDGFGRVIAITGVDPNAPGVLAAYPLKSFEYQLPVDSLHPYSKVRTSIQDGPDVNTWSYRDSWQFIDGLGRTIAAVSEADPAAGDEGAWIAAGEALYNRRNTAAVIYEPRFTNMAPEQYLLNPPLCPNASDPGCDYTSAQYDAFGRQIDTFQHDGTRVLHTEYHALSTDYYDAADYGTSEHAGTYATHIGDGFGRGARQIERIEVNGQLEERILINEYLPTGEIERVVQKRAGSPDVVRWMQYDSQGRMVLNVEPNTSSGFNPDPNTNPDAIKAWRYAYDDSGQIVGTSDARGCGVNYFYDTGGRPVADDYSPCLDHHPGYTAPNLDTGDGTELFYNYDVADPDNGTIADANGQPFDVDTTFLWGRLASVSALGSKGVYRYDARGMGRGTAVRIAAPGTPSASLATRYTPRWYTHYADFDAPGRTVRATTGMTLAELMGNNGQSEVTNSYSRRGVATTVNSSYGALVDNTTLHADGRVKDFVLGDAASTTRSYGYDINRRLDLAFTQRNSAGPWLTDPGYTPPGPGQDPTLQELLEHYSFEYDEVGNVIGIEDGRVGDNWPDTAKPVTRRFEYDDLYRLTKATYEYQGAGTDTWKSPYEYENNNPDKVQPSPHVSFDTRVQEENFSYDWLGNFSRTTDDQDGFLDRSLGDVTVGNANQGPHQLKSASNRTLAPGSTRKGDLDVAYDAAGNMTGLVVRRDGPCLPTGASCWQRFDYQWNEVGQLSRARRWDLSASGDERTQYASLNDPLPPRAPDAELLYQYSSGSRVLKTAVDQNGITRHTVYIFDSLELRTADFISGDYQYDTQTAQLRLPGARVKYAQESLPGAQSGGLHLFHELADAVGSTTLVIDHETGELVEYATYQSYGAPESDYRPERWEGFREPNRFSGKEADIEVGLSYFGARYYSAYLGVWMSPDPVSIHELGSELNPYSYVHGSPLMGVDPDGRIAFLTALIIVGVAAAISAATNTVTQLANNGWNFSQVNWGSVGVSFVVGGLTTAATLGVGSLISAPLASALGSTFGSVASGAVSGAIGGTVSYTATTLMSGGSFDLGDFAKSVAIGSIAGAAGGVGSDLTSHSDKLINSLVGGGSGAIGGFGASLAFGGELSMNSLALSIGMGLASSLATYGVREACVKKFNPGRYLERDPNNEHAYRLNAEGQKALAPAFQHTGKDLSEIRFLPGEIAGDVPGLTLGDTVRLDVDVWNASTSDYRLGLLAHEVTHTVQFDQIGAAEFGARYIEEYALGPGSNYDLPNTLRQTPITEVNMVDRAYTLDQIAQRFAVEVSPSFPVAPHSPPPPKVWAPNPGVVRDGWGAGF